MAEDTTKGSELFYTAKDGSRQDWELHEDMLNQGEDAQTASVKESLRGKMDDKILNHLYGEDVKPSDEV